MKYIFEDKESDILSVLYRRIFDETSDNFMYCEGVGSIRSNIKRLKSALRDSEDIHVFMDLTFDNVITCKEYIDTLKFIRDNEYKNVYVYPVFCSEYYFIQSLIELKILNIDDLLFSDADIINYRNSAIIRTEDDIRFCKNFEKYCKLILIKHVDDCMKHTKNSALYGVYYNNPCKCYITGCERDLDKISLDDKSFYYVSKFPYSPLNIHAKYEGFVRKEDSLRINRNLVDRFNEIVDTYMSKYGDECKAKHIPYLSRYIN